MNLARTTLLTTLLFASLNTWACFAPKDAKPSNELSEIRLPEKPFEPAVVYTVKKYAIYLKTDDLLVALRQSHHAITKPQDLLHALQSKMPLDSDLSVNALVAALAPPMPGANDELPRSEVSLEDRRFWGHVESRFSYIIADLLEQGKAAVVDLSKNEAMRTITRDKHNDVCSGGRRFIAPSGELILRTMDWVS